MSSPRDDRPPEMGPPHGRPLSIAHVCLSRGWGGLEQYPFRQAEGFRAAGHRLLYVVAEGSASRDCAVQRGLDHLPLPPWAGGLAGILRLARAIEERAVDVLHCHRSRDLRVAVLAARLAGRGRIVYTDHMGGKRPKKGLVHRFLFRHVSRVIALAAWSREKHVQILPVPPSICRVLRYGIDLGEFDPTRFPPRPFVGGLRERLGLPRTGTLVGLVARVSPGKGHEFLLHAAARLRHLEDLRFLSIGPLAADMGGDESFLSRLLNLKGELGLGDRQRFTDYRQDVPAVLACLDMVAVPSDFEAFGLSVPEAMAMGRPVIATDAGGPAETIRHEVTGLHVPPRDPAALAGAIARLHRDPSLRSFLTGNGLDEARSYAMELHRERMVELYRQILPEG